MISFSTVANGRDIKVYEILQKMFQNFGKVSKNFYFAKIPYYFCSGLMLINMNEWRTRNIQHNSLEFLHKYKSHFADQDALNAIIMGDIVVLPPTFGILIFQTAMSLKNGDSNCHFLRQILTTSKIIHFNGYAKPWMPKYSYLDATYTPLDYPYHEQWWDMARQTAAPVCGRPS